MSSSFIQIKPIGLPRSWNNPLALTQSPDFPQARRRVSCNLFGKPDRGAINEMYRRDEKQRLEQFQQRYEIIELDMLSASDDLLLSTSKPKFTAITRPTTASASSSVVVVPKAANNTTTATNIIAESRLLGSSSGGGDGCGESLIEKELREHEMKLKLKQQRKKTVAIGNNNCSNEKLVIAGDRIKSRTSSKLEEQSAVAAAVTTAVARTFVDSSKCASGHGERPKPYARQQQLQQSSITDYYAQRKTVVCNNSRTASTSEVEEVLPPQVHDESSPIKATIISSSAISHNNESASHSSSSSSSSTVDEQESSSQEQTLHTMTTEKASKPLNNSINTRNSHSALSSYPIVTKYTNLVSS